MIPDVEPSSESIIHEPEQVPGVTNQYRCRIEFKDFHKTARIVGLPVTNQYLEEIQKEEEFHKKNSGWVRFPRRKAVRGTVSPQRVLYFLPVLPETGPITYMEPPQRMQNKKH